MHKDPKDELERRTGNLVHSKAVFCRSMERNILDGVFPSLFCCYGGVYVSKVLIKCFKNQTNVL